MTATGAATTVTGTEEEPTVPFASATVQAKVRIPGVSAVKVIALVPWPPVIDPPVIAQEKEPSLDAEAEAETPVVPAVIDDGATTRTSTRGMGTVIDGAD